MKRGSLEFDAVLNQIVHCTDHMVKRLLNFNNRLKYTDFKTYPCGGHTTAFQTNKVKVLLKLSVETVPSSDKHINFNQNHSNSSSIKFRIIT